MQITRKIILLGLSSKGVTLPKSWIDFWEEKEGKIEAVSMDVNKKITIHPIFKSCKKREESLE
jgi:hypothetical protein